MLLGFDFIKPIQGVIISAAAVGVIVLSLGIYATLTISETHGKDLDFTE